MVLYAEDVLKSMVTNEYQYWYLYERLLYPLFVVCTVTIIFTIIKIIKFRIKQTEPLQLEEISMTISYVALAVTTVVLSILVTYCDL